ncbi:lactate utilization protein [Deferribacterales bacterium Es71-Z0220]|uniref:lactate utilization protein n=1 Tax=Deferrivibrio essentukiensis TaxID=2880922 RepID=UPI001F61F1A1|nr:lactate utilization protein [Deferrivibrio essentukiensis]MCB4204463.1 lactate utilization protein [Deferrivibrio essentukiensis]
MEIVKKWFNERTASLTIENLEKNGFKASYFEKSETALKYIESIAQDFNRIGFGGSMTVLHDLKLDELLKAKGKEILNHNIGSLSPEEKLEIRKRQLTCDLFITSTNALTKDGKLINTDGVGNRVAAMIFGPKKTLVLAGVNKIVKDVNAGLSRIKEIASPMNTKRLNVNTPCAVTGVCSDCNSPQRICRVTTIIEKKPNFSDIEIIIIGENLGY